MRARAGAAIAAAIVVSVCAWAPAVSARTAGEPAAGLRVHGARRSPAALAAGITRAAGTDRAAVQNSTAKVCTDALVVSEDTVLTTDAPCGLTVDGEGITVDLGGHTVGDFVLGGCPMTLRNGTVAGAIFSCGNSRFERLTVRGTDSPDTPGLLAGFGDIVRHNTFAGNDVAIDTFYAGGTFITQNLFRHNRLAVWSNDSGENIVANTFARNTTGVSIFDEEDCAGCGGGHVIAANLFRSNNIGVSIGALFGGQDNMLRNNAFDRNNSAGVRMQIDCTTESGAVTCGGAGSVVADNVFTWNGWRSNTKTVDDGFSGLSYLDGALGGRGLNGVNVARNVAKHNADLGLQAPRAHDGGGNVGKYNGDPRQCVGVRCG